MDQSIPQMLNEKQAARLLAVSTAALRRWRREGRGPEFVRCERCVRYDVRAIELFIVQNSSVNRKATDSQLAPGREVRDGDATLRS